ncbi:hypothetical protein ES319_A13G212500v1 [Gossypium barbadense]|uniref:Legume lectin domain-containing protein n=2 Tax=Gossypium TaxID=3633 RepID=A0A5J5T283_GOSBA|nr:hypothetical protein ES319_A13G212500v1 [Gossypium barbadense]TYG87574.1 hypothetical protein ES288_A13G226000v1 [Gossypium darwinii]
MVMVILLMDLATVIAPLGGGFANSGYDNPIFSGFFDQTTLSPSIPTSVNLSQISFSPPYTRTTLSYEYRLVS